jgi:peptidoglycan hydrolase-like protein with peptidoglycan-binding domain
MALWNKVKTLVPDLADVVQGTAPPAETYSINWLQESLNKLINAGLTVDGKYGAGTQAAVKKFQEANGLTPDGWAGVQTQAKIAELLG